MWIISSRRCFQGLKLVKIQGSVYIDLLLVWLHQSAKDAESMTFVTGSWSAGLEKTLAQLLAGAWASAQGAKAGCFKASEIEEKSNSERYGQYILTWYIVRSSHPISINEVFLLFPKCHQKNGQLFVFTAFQAEMPDLEVSRRFFLEQRGPSGAGQEGSLGIWGFPSNGGVSPTGPWLLPARNWWFFTPRVWNGDTHHLRKHLFFYSTGKKHIKRLVGVAQLIKLILFRKIIVVPFWEPS